jgi:hypothetical protein
VQTESSLYNAQISAGSLLLKESREIATLLLDQTGEVPWRRALVVDNVLQKKSPSSALRMAGLIRNRIGTMDPDFWRLVLDSDREVALQALLAAAIQHSRLLEDFLTMVVKEHFRTFKRQLTLGDWRSFLAECEKRDQAAASWSDTTKKKLRQVIIRILAEAGYLESSRNMQLSPIQIHPKVRAYLETHGLKNILRGMEIDR